MERPLTRLQAQHRSDYRALILWCIFFIGPFVMTIIWAGWYRDKKAQERRQLEQSIEIIQKMDKLFITS